MKLLFLACLIGFALAADPLLYDKIAKHVKLGGTKDALNSLFVEEVISHPGATWIRLIFGKNTNAPMIRITSQKDGAVQHLNPTTLEQWQYTSAYFNGDSVLVELIDQKGRASDYEIEVNGVYAGLVHPLNKEKSLCGPDSRELSSYKRAGRFLGGGGCSGWLIDDRNHCFLTAHHCGTDDTGGGVMEFEVPLSRETPFGHEIVHPPPEHQYSLDPKSLLRARTPTGIGNDWQYFGCFPNTETGLTPYQRQGDCYILSTNLTVPDEGRKLHIIGYGVVEFDKPGTWNQVQKESFGPFVSSNRQNNIWSISYTVDTTGGDSGSGIEMDGVAIGVHTHGGCSRVFGGTNSGTFIGHPDLQAALKSPQGVCGN